MPEPEQAALPPLEPESRPGRPGYIAALDGLRAVAVLAVVAYHLDELPGGFFGVDVFFVISGFLITRLLLAERERTGGIALGSFWIRRFKRLVPALFLVLVAVAVGSRLWLPAWRLGEIRLDALAGIGYVANWRFILSGQSYFQSGLPPSPLRHTWSLAIEEQFYVLWPLIVVLVAKVAGHNVRRGVAIVAAVAMAVSAGWMAASASIGMDLSRIYYGTDTRVFALFGGALLGTWWDPASQAGRTRTDRRRWAVRWATAGAVAFVPVVAFFVFGSNAEAVMYQGAFQLLALCAVVLVAGVATGRGPFDAVLAHPVLVWVGRRSYGIYLWSWPTQVFLQEYWGLEGGVLAAAVVALSIALAALSFWLVEEPIRTGRRPIGFGERRGERRTSRIPNVAFSAMALLLVIGVVVGTSAGAPEEPDYASVSDEEVLDAALGDLTPAEADALREAAATSTTVPIDEGPPGPFTGAEEVVVDPAASVDPSLRLGRPLKIMVAGDSVGWSLAWALKGGVTDRVTVQESALIACGLMPPDAKFIVGGRDPEQYGEGCRSADLVELSGLGNVPDVVLLWVGAWEVYDHEYQGVTYRVGTERYATLLRERMQERIDRYRGVGAATIMPVVPCFGPNAARLGKERHDADRIDWVNEQIRAVALRNAGWVRLVDPAPKLCDAEGGFLTATPDGIPLRQDGAHFDPESAIWLWNTWLAGQMGAAFDVAAPTTTTTTTTTTAGG
ncbi:acyltransferase family protein [Aquihabitans daechungensis]|uniref:acyltransferase family protein n=1 Tax=Aquihabitans daechungensis TaxID=1052257 RepID=UPI003BA2170F